ncbi:hypothetical protein ACLQ24_05465 [Micromonospora sp. DT4]|uniref:hypothetical protein n=1 Tax=Micromonospora sp. DT4 TaxID=3393438 RepID=UPI003CEB14F8
MLFYEPEGLLLTAGLLPADVGGREYRVMFQLSYLGSGEITAHVGFEQCDGTDKTAPEFVTVELLGAARHRMPIIWTASASVRAEQVNCRLIIWGEPAGDDLLRGELIAEVSGRLPVLTATCQASVTQAELPTRERVS